MKKLLLSIASLLFIHSASAQASWVLDTTITTGANTSGIAITPDNSKLVITNNTNPGKVKVISTSTYSIVTIDVSSIENNPNAVAITPNGALAMVNTTHKTIFIDLTNNTVCGNYPAPCVGTTLYGIAANNTIAVYGDLSAGCTQQGVRTINPNCSTSSSGFILDNSGGQLYGIALDNTGNNALLTGFTGHGPTKVNLTSSAVTNITGMTQSYGVAMLHNTNEALVYTGDSIARVSLTSNSTILKICDLSYNTSFQNIAITSDDHYAFCIGAFDKRIIDLTTNTVIQPFSSGQTNVACKTDGSKFYVTDSYNGTVRVYKIIASGIHELNKNNLKVSVYPNPANKEFVIETNSIEPQTLELFDLTGKQVLSKSVSEKTIIDASILNEGVYTLTIRTTGSVSTKKLVVLR